DVRVGDFVVVEGSVMGAGFLYADSVSISEVEYVPGATEVFVTGLLTEIDQSRGIARLGDLTIDYTPSLGAGQAPSDVMWSFRGIRPVATGLMISELSNRFAQ
ncbi:MAG TPA: hypothetical protein VJ993_04550, partial [Woeseiaceae bacterium]|nr:hypothetical protein [Woeseiaceae bacterium]